MYALFLDRNKFTETTVMFRRFAFVICTKLKMYSMAYSCEQVPFKILRKKHEIVL